MSEMESQGFYYPNKMGRIVLQAMEEVIGRNGVNAALDLAHLPHLIDNYPPNNLDLEFGFDQISYMQTALEDMYGWRGGRGLALRSGRACFKYGLREMAPSLGRLDPRFQFLPLRKKLRMGSKYLAEIINAFSDQRVHIEEDGDRLLWHIERCPICWQRRSKVPVCHLAIGALQEALYWVSGGKCFNIQETRCIAVGDPACTFVIEKSELD